MSKGTYSPNNIFFKRRNAILMTYIGLLLSFTFVFFVTLQISGVNQDYELNEKEAKVAFDEAYENRDLISDAVKVIKEWTFDFDSEKVIIRDQFTLYEIDVIYTDRNDIQVTQYMMNFDHPIIKFVPPAEIWQQNQGTELTIAEPGHYINIKGVYNEFPVRQMEGISMMDSDYLLERESMKQYFLIEVPEGVKVELEY